MAHQNEHRSSHRTAINWPVSVWHPTASMFFNGRSVNVSRAGVLVTLPMKAPIRQGQHLELNFPRSKPLANSKGGFARIKTARVVRIDRDDTLNSTDVKVGLEFFAGPIVSSKA